MFDARPDTAPPRAIPAKMPATLAREQILALAMARHARLGAASRAKCLNADALSHVHKYVCEAHQELASTKRISKICVKTGDVVDRIEIHFSDGAFISSGGGGGEWRLPATLEVGEYITGIGGRKGDSLDAIYFTTNLGRAHNFAGRINGGRVFHMPIEPGHELISLTASSPPGRTWLKSILGYKTVSSPWTSPMARLLLAVPNRAIFEPGVTRPFLHRVGALGAGHDLDVRVCTWEEAKARALELPNCAGFTFNSAAPRFEGVMEVFFKGRRHGNNDWRWQTWLKTDWNGADPPQTNWPGNAHEDMGGPPMGFMGDDEDDDEDDEDDEEEEEDDDDDDDEFDVDHDNM